jgi:outer membrane biosynthesis protein TonB
MNRLEKKCFISAAAAHTLLFVILFVGPAFFVPSNKENSFKEITVYSAADISKAMSSGGTPENVRANPLPPPPAPTAEPKPPEPTPKPPEIPKPAVKPPPDLEPVKPEVKIKPVERGDEPAPPKKKHVVTLDENALTSSKPDKNKLKQAADDARKAQAAAEAKQHAADAKAFNNALKNLKSDLSGRTTVAFDPGVGGGGKATINYFQLIQSTLDNAWHPSQTLGDDTPSATISVTISRDGTLRGRISKHSGNSRMDASVQSVLDTVTSVEPFPESFTEQQITASFTFDIKAKR